MENHQGASANLLFCVNQKMLGLMSACLKSLLRSGGYGYYDVFVLHSDLEESIQRAMERDFQERVTFHFLQVPEELFADFPETARYPRQIYYRLAAPLLLPRELDRILYLDVDVVVINSLRPFYEVDFESSYFVGCTHTREFLTKLNQARLQSDKAVAYINTGVLLMNLNVLRQVIRLEEISAYVREHEKALIMPDQDILTALYGAEIKLVDSLHYHPSARVLNFYNGSHPKEKRDVNWVRRNTAIIHYCGRNKPWNEGYTGTLGVFYRELMDSVPEK